MKEDGSRPSEECEEMQEERTDCSLLKRDSHAEDLVGGGLGKGGRGFGLATCVKLQQGLGHSVRSSPTKLFPLGQKVSSVFFFFLRKYITLLLEGARPWAPAGSMEALWGSAGGVLRQGRG